MFAISITIRIGIRIEASNWHKVIFADSGKSRIWGNNVRLHTEYALRRIIVIKLYVLMQAGVGFEEIKWDDNSHKLPPRCRQWQCDVWNYLVLSSRVEWVVWCLASSIELPLWCLDEPPHIKTVTFVISPVCMTTWWSACQIWARRTKIYWILILKSPLFVPFDANLTRFGPKYDIL